MLNYFTKPLAPKGSKNSSGWMSRLQLWRATTISGKIRHWRNFFPNPPIFNRGA